MSIERRIVTVLFADLVDFTPLSERLDAEDLATIQDAYFAVVRDTVGRYGGTLEKFIGDAVMAAFGLGTARDDDAERAVRAGLALINGVESLGARLGLDVDALRIRVGVNTGEAVVAPAVPSEGLGTEGGRVTGDTVNVAARLQAAASPGRVLVGADTALAVEGAIELEPAQAIALKGKAEPVPARFVIAVRPEPSRELAMGGMVAPTVGRGEELDRLIAASERARAGPTQRVLIVAPPGVGKSRLLGELAASIDDGATVVWRTRSRQGASVPFALVRDVLTAALATVAGGADGLVARVEAIGVSPARARVVVDAARPLLALASTSPDVPERDAPDRRDLVAAWTTVLRACAADRSVCWLAEDLHWAGADEIAFVEGLTADADWHRLLVVATGRQSVTGRVDKDWGQLDLAPLAIGDARDLIEALVGDALPPDLVERILDRSDGNPLFIEELLRTWVSVGTLERSRPGGPWRLAAAATDIQLPTTIQAIYASQLDDLSGEARGTARRAAVAGRRFPVEALPELGAMDPDLAVAELTRRAVVNGPQADDLLGDTYGYRHALVRDAGYASLARAERADLHLRLAHWLEGAAGGDAGLIAAAIGGHYADGLANASALTSTVGTGFDRVGVAALAASWLERAGETAMATAAYDAARESLGRAVELTPDGDLLDRGRRLTRLGQSFSGSGSLDQAIDADERAVACFEAVLALGTMGDVERGVAQLALATAARALGMARFEQTRFRDAADIAARALALVGDDDRATVPLELLAIEAELALTNDARSLFAQMADVRRRAETTGDPDLALEAIHTDVRVRTEAGQATADEFFDLAVRFEARRRWREATSAMVNALKSGATDETFEEKAARADALADAHGLAESSVWIGMLRALRGLESGDWARATDQALAGIGIGEANGYHRAVVRSWFVLGPIAAARGDRATLERAAGWFAVRDRESTFPDSPYGRLMHEGIAIDLASVGLRDRPRPAISRFEAAFALPYDSSDWLAAIERVIGAMLDAGLVDDARVAVDLVPAPAPGRDPLTAVSDALTRAWVAEADGDGDAAIAQARAGLGFDAAATAPWWTYRLLRVLDRGGAATSVEVDRAREIASRLGLGASVRI